MLKRLQTRAQQEELAILSDGGNVDGGDARDLKAILDSETPTAVAAIQIPSFNIRKPTADGGDAKRTAIAVKPSTAQRQPKVKGSMMDDSDDENNGDITNSISNLDDVDNDDSHEEQPTSDIYDF